MESKSSVDEKRVRSTVIRRRAIQPVAPPEMPPEEPKKEASQVPTVTAKEVVPTPAAKETVAAPVVSAQPETLAEKAEKENKAKKAGKRKSRDELEMEMIERAGGLKKVAELIETNPERLERVYRPERNSKRKKVLARKEFKKTELTTPKAIKKVIRIEKRIPVGELAHRMSIKSGEVVKKLMELGVMVTVNEAIDADTAILVAHDFGYEVENVAFEESTVLKQVSEGQNTQPRPPVVTVMGHVDHGKTSLLDWIRKTQVASGEAGGITQHIGAYQVQLPKGTITFIDTPGHEAFTAMRARGARVTDLVVLVVAAEDGVKPQTIEAIHHAKAAKVPILVAINKVDKPDADPARVERQLMEHGLISEKLGGDVIIVPLSAKTGQGVATLLEMILLQAEVLELHADPTVRSKGIVIESRVDRGRGPVATVILQCGTLKTGDPFVAGRAFGRVRTMIDSKGQEIREAGASAPVEILGLSEVPMAGDTFDVCVSEEDAREVARHRSLKEREGRDVARRSMEELYAESQKVELPELRVLIKADVHGSAEALREALSKIVTEKAKVSVLHWGVGAINESDVMLAVTSKAVILGFNTRPDNKGRELAEREKVDIRKYSIIYEVLEDVRKMMTGMIEPLKKEIYLGRAEVKQLFKVSKIGTVAGCGVVDGKIVRTGRARVLRDGKVVYEGRLSSLKRFKDDAREVLVGQECGMGIENFNDLKQGDQIEAYEVQEIAQEL